MQKHLSILLSLTFLICLSFSTNAQELAEDQRKGYILDSKGKKKEGIIELSSLRNPWSNQRSIKFIDTKTWEKSKGKLKKKDKEKFKAKDLQGYGFDDREFVTVKYTAVAGDDGSDVNKFTSRMSTISNLTKNQHMVERLLDGEVSVYRFYSYPPEASAYKGSEKEQYEAMIEGLRTTPSILMKKGKKGKIKDFEDLLGFKKFIGDCEKVLTKYENNEYMKKSKLKVKGMVKDALSGSTAEDKCLEIMRDYNEFCGK